MKPAIPQAPYGAVYFRKSNPPKEDWQTDYAQAQKDGMNVFRHWFLWGAIEVKPEEYDWSEYDQHMDLAAEHGMKVIISERSASVPMWLYRRRPDIFCQDRNGRTAYPQWSGSCGTGNFADICLEHEEGAAYIDGFLRELVTRYRNHEALLGYDIWNETYYLGYRDFHPKSVEAWQRWLQEKYETLKALNQAWQRHSYAEWDEVMIPEEDFPIPESVDWWLYQRHRFQTQYKKRIDLVRKLDPNHWITAHGSPGIDSSDHWICAEEVEIYGYTWVASRMGAQPWKQWSNTDWVRAGSREKPFWHAEAQGGPLWLQPQVLGRKKQDGRVTTPEDVRIWSLTSFATGTRGQIYTRWRSLLDGQLMGAFGLYGMDGSPNAQSEMASSIGKWMNKPEQKDLFEATPIRGEIAILFVPEAQCYHRLQYASAWAVGERNLYQESLWGAYRGFFDLNVQADYVRIDHIDEYEILYLPHSILLFEENSRKLLQWVENGGTLISQACPAYFSGLGRAGTVQPNLGWDHMFGAKEAEVELMPDIGDEISFTWEGQPIRGGMYRQAYEVDKGSGLGEFADGKTAVVENTHGKGKALLVGSFPSVGYFRSEGEENREYFIKLVEWSGMGQKVKSSHPSVKARLHEGPGGLFLWILNVGPEEADACIELSSSLGNCGIESVTWGVTSQGIEKNRWVVSLPAKDALVVKLSPAH